MMARMTWLKRLPDRPAPKPSRTTDYYAVGEKRGLSLIGEG